MQRRARVLSVGAQVVTVRLEDSACEGCSSGCGGRCDLFRSDECNQFTLVCRAQVVPGQLVMLTVGDRQLRTAALHGYGRALLGLLLGAAAGAALAHWLEVAADPLVLIGLVLGVAAALWHPRSRAVNPLLTPIAAD